MPTRDADPLRPRLRKGREAREKPPGGTLLRRLQRRAVRHRPGWHQRSWRGRYVAAPGTAAQRVVVKVEIMRPGRSGHTSWTAGLRQHLDYLQREGVALGGEAGQMYTRNATGVETAGFLGRSADDPHQFRFIVSAERGTDLDLTHFTRSFLGQVEDDVGTRLDWVAVNHYDTDHLHTHVLVRGTDDHGQPLALQRHYIAEGLRYRAQEIATRELGPRVERDVPREVAPERVRASAPPLRRDRGLDLDI